MLFLSLLPDALASLQDIGGDPPIRIRLIVTPLTNCFSSVRTSLIILHAFAKRFNCEISDLKVYSEYCLFFAVGTFIMTHFSHVFCGKRRRL